MALSYNDQYYDENNLQREFDAYVYLITGLLSIPPLGAQIMWLTRDSTKNRILMKHAFLFYFGLGIFSNCSIIIGGIMYEALNVFNLISLVV